MRSRPGKRIRRSATRASRWRDPPAYFERHAKPDTLDDLAAHDCPRYRFSTGGGIYRWGFAQPGDSRRVFEVETHDSFVSNDLRTMVKAVEQGVGLLH